MISQEEVKDLRAQFEAIDTARTGMIDMNELTEVMNKKGIKIHQDAIDSIIKEVDYYGNR